MTYKSLTPSIECFAITWILENLSAIILMVLFIDHSDKTLLGSLGGFVALCELDVIYGRPLWFVLLWLAFKGPNVTRCIAAPVLSLAVTFCVNAMFTPAKFVAFISGNDLFERVIFYKILCSGIASCAIMFFANRRSPSST